MDLTGEYRIPAPREAVWAALNDPEILKQCIPGCEEIVKLSDTEMTAKVTARVGPVKASFAGKVTLSDLDPPNGYRISGEGQGGVAGFAKGGADVSLASAGQDTRLSYKVKANVGGKLAQIGSRLVDAAANKVAGDFFAAWGGIASLEVALPATWTAASARGFGVEAIARWMSAAPARLAGIESRKGAIAVGRDADLVLFDPDAAFVVDAAALRHRHPLTPYDRMALRGRVVRTWLRGRAIYDEGRLRGEPSGELLAR